MKNDILLFGMQGAGKGTQGALLAKKYDLTIFETGAELRKIREEDSPLGQTVKSIMDKGDLVSNEIVMDLIENFLSLHQGKQILFDGIPRMMEQKITFDALLKKYGRTLTGIFLTLPEEEAIDRMMKRGRKDDIPDVIRRRLENYNTETLPVIQKYIADGVVTEVSGEGSIDEIAERIMNVLSEKKDEK